MGKAKRKVVVFTIAVKASEDQLKGFKGMPAPFRNAIKKGMTASAQEAFDANLNKVQEHLYKVYGGMQDDNN